MASTKQDLGPLNEEADPLVIVDGRQSETAAAVQRGTCRMWRDLGHATLTELPLANGRRADVVALDRKGGVLIVEIKSSIEDFRADSKWPEYCDFCDSLYFAIPADVPQDIIPAQAGLIVADRYDAEILRHGDRHPLTAARRKAVTLRFARAAAQRLQTVFDPAGAL